MKKEKQNIEKQAEKENMNIVIVGHVDHGKSTLIGRLLYDTKSIPDGVFEEIQKVSEELGRDVEFAYLLDSLEEEREQNVTIDTTQIFFNTPKRDYTIIDAPGHREFLKNMITGASLAEAAILIIDAKEGVKEQTARHAYILSMLGLKQVVVVINKMDSLDYSEEGFEKVRSAIIKFLEKLKIRPSHVIPISAMKGDNIIKKSENMPWYKGLAVLAALDSFLTKESITKNFLRFPVQDVYKIEDKRILVGRIEAGKLKQDEEVVFLPSNKKTRIKSIEVWNKHKTGAETGECIGVILEDPLFVERGEIMCSGELPSVKQEVNANIFWMSKEPGTLNEKFDLKCSTQKISCFIEKIMTKFNSSTLEKINEDRDKLEETEVGTVLIKVKTPLVIENFSNVEELGRFVLVKDDIIVAGGIHQE